MGRGIEGVPSLQTGRLKMHPRRGKLLLGGCPENCKATSMKPLDARFTLTLPESRVLCREGGKTSNDSDHYDVIKAPDFFICVVMHINNEASIV